MNSTTSNDTGTPTITTAPTGHHTLHWAGPDYCQVARYFIEEFIAEHNELIDLRAAIARWSHPMTPANSRTTP